jgi:hypothetical protein
MELADPLEFRFANTYLDGYEHWTMLCNCTWFKPIVARWRNELELKIRSEALLRLEQDAVSGSRSSAQSNRFLLDRGWVLEKNTKGRPSKAEIKKEAQKAAQLQKDTEADLARIKPTNQVQ